MNSVYRHEVCFNKFYTMKTLIQSLTVAALCICSYITSAQQFQFGKTNYTQSYFTENAVQIDSVFGFVYFKKDTVSIDGFVESYKTIAGLGELDELVLIDMLEDNLPINNEEEEPCEAPLMFHGLYQHTHNGYAVENSTLIVHYDNNDFVWYIQDNLINNIVYPTTITYDMNDALNTTINQLNIVTMLSDSLPSELPTGEICYTIHPTSGLFVLANKVNFTSIDPLTTVDAYVDASTNSFIKFNNLERGGSILSSFHHIYYGQHIYGLNTYTNGGNNYLAARANNRFINTTDNTYYHDEDFLTPNYWDYTYMPKEGNPQDAFWASDHWSATSSHYCAQFAWDFFKNDYQHNGWDKNGKMLRIVSDYKAFGSYQTMFFPSQISDNMGYMLIGRASNNNLNATYDIVGHEYAHGIMHYSSLFKNVTDKKIEGSASESFADIFGTMVERSAKWNAFNWQMGEDAELQRDMQNPASKNQPSHYSHTFWKNVSGCTPTKSNDQCFVYTNMGVMNRWFYILTNGGTENVGNQTRTMTGAIGIEKAARIAYETMMYHIYASNDLGDIDFLRVRASSIAAANKLYGLNSAESRAVCRAWFVVNTGPSCDVPPGEEIAWYNWCEPSPMLMSVDELGHTLLEKMKVYPNPATQYLTIEYPHNFNMDTRYLVRDIFGKIVMEEQKFIYTKTRLDISHFANGVYFIEAICGNNRKVSRFVVAH